MNGLFTIDGEISMSAIAEDVCNSIEEIENVLRNIEATAMLNIK